MKYKISLSAEKIDQDLIRMFDGVGMIRSEYILRKNKMYITKIEMQKIVRDYVEGVAKSFAPKDVWYRTIEMSVNDINKLEGVDKKLYEVDFMAGSRGIRRSLKYPRTFKKELSIISDLSKNYTNLHILLPFIFDVKELKATKKILDELNYKNKVGIMAEIPSTILCLDDFCKAGIDNITVGLNDLTEFTLASARDQRIYTENRNHPAVIKMISSVSEIGKKYQIETVLGGDINKTMVELAKELNFDAISVFSKDINYIKGDLIKSANKN